MNNKRNALAKLVENYIDENGLGCTSEMSMVDILNILEEATSIEANEQKISRLDYFAAKAMQSKIITRPTHKSKSIAQASYTLAKAMLKQSYEEDK